MLTDLRNGLWSEASANRNVDIYRRNLQRTYLDRMAYLMTEEPSNRRFNRPGFEGRLSYDVSASDVRSLVRGELNALRSRLRSTKSRVNTVTRYHYEDAIARIDQLLDPND